MNAMPEGGATASTENDTTSLKPDPFSELRGLMAEATPGPWEVTYLDENDQQVISGAPHEVATFWHHCVGSIEKEMRANAALVVAAVNALPALLDERDRLIGEAAEAKRMAHEAFCIGVSHQEARRAAEAEVEKLKALLKPICSEFAQSHPLIASARQALSQEIG